jgi:polyhydroxyalkanoate synthase
MSAQDEPRPISDPAEIVKTYADVAHKASRLIGSHIRRQMRHGISSPGDELGVARAFMDMAAQLLANPYKLAQAQMGLLWDYMALWQNALLRCSGLAADPLATPARGDNRFKSEEWQNHFLYDYIKQSYLITAHHIQNTVADVKGLDEQAQKKVSFFTRQFIDACAPSNFVLTNPDVLRETLRSHGTNLVRGLNNLLRDLEAGDGQLRVRMTDTSAFEMGKNVAVTPGKVIFQNDLMQLLQFAPTTPKQYARPVLIFPPWINKYYILDLREKNSLIKWMTDQGHSVFVMSWVNPDQKLAQKTFDDYLTEGALTAVEKVCAQTGAQEINGVGYCLGGTLLATTLAWMAARKDTRLCSGTFFTTMIDFSIPGELGVFIDEEQITSLERKMGKSGYLDGGEMAGTFNLLRANDLIWSFVVNNYLMGKDPFPFDLLYWNSDSTRMPAAMHSFYLRNMYLKNRLKDPGALTIGGVAIDMTKIKVPAYFVSTVEDHIAPWKSTYLGARLFSGPLHFVLGGSGHIAGIVNPPAAKKYGYWHNPGADRTGLPASGEDWLSGATQTEGSWWPDWQAWVSAQNKDQVAARDPSRGKLKPIEDAPGSYATFRLDTTPGTAA